jgi:hypothetical protein
MPFFRNYTYQPIADTIHHSNSCLRGSRYENKNSQEARVEYYLAVGDSTHIKMDSDELTGLIASFLAAVSFGSYGVPMKGEAATRVDVDPLVFQTYKAVTVFVSCNLPYSLQPLYSFMN